jgi:hypothetical protein
MGEDGLIGPNVFERFLVTLEFPKRTLRLDPLPSRGGTASPKDEVYDREIPEEYKSFTQVFHIGHSLMIPTKVGTAEPALFIIDTGSNITMISREAAAQVTKVQRDDTRHIKGLSGKVNEVFSARELVLQFAGFQQKNVDLITVDVTKPSEGLGMEIGGFLGLPLLNMFTLSIDYRDGLVGFHYKPPPGYR